MKILAIIIGILLLASSAFAVGPYMKDPHTAAWDPNPESDLSGYYLYWRPTGGTWDNARRAQVAISPAPTFNLLTVINVNGNYEIAVSAFNAAGNESGMSNIVPFVVNLPSAPTNTRVQAP